MIQYYYVLALKARTDYMFCAGFFHTRKNLKNFSKEVIKSHLAVLIWCGKRDKHFSNHKGKEVRLMKPSDFQKTVQCRFESCLKKVVRSVVKDYYKELNRRKNKEISFSELPDVLVDKMAVWDDYETDYTIFSVCGIDIRVLDDELFYPQLGVKLCSMAGGGVQKIYMVFLRELSRRDRSGSDLFHLRDGFEIKMNFDRNVSCFIFVNALMYDDFFD